MDITFLVDSPLVVSWNLPWKHLASWQLSLTLYLLSQLLVATYGSSGLIMGLKSHSKWSFQMLMLVESKPICLDKDSVPRKKFQRAKLECRVWQNSNFQALVFVARLEKLNLSYDLKAFINCKKPALIESLLRSCGHLPDGKDLFSVENFYPF